MPLMYRDMPLMFMAYNEVESRHVDPYSRHAGRFIGGNSQYQLPPICGNWFLSRKKKKFLYNFFWLLNSVIFVLFRQFEK